MCGSPKPLWVEVELMKKAALILMKEDDLGLSWHLVAGPLMVEASPGGLASEAELVLRPPE